MGRITRGARKVLSRERTGKVPRTGRDQRERNRPAFTQRATKAISLAHREAAILDHDYLGTEHLLLGLVAEGGGVAARVLREHRVTPETARAAVEYLVGRGTESSMGTSTQTPRLERVFELAFDEARRQGHHYIGTEHLLLGLVREGEGMAASVLDRLEVPLGGISDDVARIIKSGEFAPDPDARDRSPAPPPRGPKNNVVTIRLTDRDVDALDALVEAGIRSTRSDAAAWLIGIGIEAQRPLFDRVNATVNEIRQLRAEARTLADRVPTERPTDTAEEDAVAEDRP